MDKTSSVTLLGVMVKMSKLEVSKLLPHSCKVPGSHRQHPAVADDQTLRNMRHRCCKKKYIDKFATCPHCGFAWSNEEFLQSYLINSGHVPSLTALPDHNTRRLKSYLVQHQMPEQSPIANIRPILDAAYNHHCHSKSCFKKNGGTNKRKKQILADECRYGFPKRRKVRSCVETMSEDKVRWYSWNGTYEMRNFQEAHRKRDRYDAFQNTNCSAISWSKIGGNSNINCNMYGPVSQYNMKYTTKGNQEEESQAYSALSAKLMKIVETRKHQIDASESTRRVMAGAFAHQEANIIGAPLASYLTRHQSRFLFSHEFQWCPLRDLHTLLSGGNINASISYNYNQPFFQVSAMHYLCRPAQLENISVYDFYSKYETVRQSSKNRDNLLQFITTTDFTHPSFSTKTGRHMQGVWLKENIALPQIFQYDFPDTATFQGDILDDAQPISDNMEQYAKHALLLFLPFRVITDLQSNTTYTKRLRDAVATAAICPTATTFLQNIQNSKSNSFRMAKHSDDLQRVTKAYVPTGIADNDKYNKQTEEEEERNSLVGTQLDRLIELTETDQNNATGQAQNANRLSLKQIRDKGRLKCGYECLSSTSHHTDNTIFIESSQNMQSANIPQPSSTTTTSICTSKPTTTDIVKLLFTKTARIQKTFSEITGSTESVNVYEANGSAKSIVDWARKAGLDVDQCRAFETMAATFVLSYYDDAAATGQPPQGRSTRRRAMLKEKVKLNKLAGRTSTREKQLIYFMHGPGGCGKSTVIDLVLAYASEYCTHLPNTHFTSKTIVVTAMTGVAASIIRGTTTHSSLYLNNKHILGEHVELWEETRMVLVDEISFASKEDFIQIDKCLRQLKQEPDSRYGGIDIVFSGDLRQLEPVGDGKKAIYMDNCAQFKSWLNSYTELNGLHRFKNDPAYGEFLMRLRNGRLTTEDIESINRDCVVRDGDPLPEDLQYACFHNRDRDSINTALFLKRCEELRSSGQSLSDTLLILSDKYQVQNGTKQFVPFNNSPFIWQNCSRIESNGPGA